MSWENIIRKEVRKMPVPASELTPTDTRESAKKDFFAQLGRSDSNINKYLNTLFEEKIDPELNQMNLKGKKRIMINKTEFNSWDIRHNNHPLSFNTQEMQKILATHYTEQMGYRVSLDKFHPNELLYIALYK
jgi:hypothetical protein